MVKNMLVFVGGGIGAVFRYFLAGWIYRAVGTDFPYGTLVVNVIGCFVIGLFMTMAEDRFLIIPSMRIFVAVGIIGGFTTFSTFNFETLELLKDGAFTLGLLNIGASIVLGLLATWIGAVVGRII
ncbi:MAG TPA: fluoride efflux transporter CrcB [Candidatus Acidoferrales bacterium]|nr:fluoride efflux transporter CrcB [Candidatus Acidoferrales bacterium]